MQVILDVHECWSLMTLMVSRTIDHAGVGGEGKAALRRWRSDHAEGTAPMAELTIAMNEALGSALDEKTYRLIRKKGWYEPSHDREEGP